MSIKMISLDTSTSCSGIAIFLDGVYQRSFVIETPEKIKGDDKLDQMIDLIYAQLSVEKPDIILTEMVIPTRNAQATRMLQELTGAVRGFCIEHSISYYTLRPSEWRSGVIRKFNQKPKGRKRENLKQWSLNIVNNCLGIATGSNDESDSILLAHAYIELFR